MDVLLMPYSMKCPTVDYMCPMKMREYMAAGKAIISSDVPVIKNVLRSGENCILVAPDNPDALFSAIQTLQINKQLRCALGKTARKQVEGCTWQARAAKVLEYLKELRRKQSIRI